MCDTLCIHVYCQQISSAVHRGVSCDSRFVGGDACNKELNGDTRRRDSDLDRFGLSDRHNTLRPVSLLDCIEYQILFII